MSLRRFAELFQSKTTNREVLQSTRAREEPEREIAKRIAEENDQQIAKHAKRGFQV